MNLIEVFSLPSQNTPFCVELTLSMGKNHLEKIQTTQVPKL